MSETAGSLIALSDALADTVEGAGQFIVSVSARRRAPATGIMWKPNLIVTADHVIERPDAISVTAPDGTKRTGTLTAHDPSTDIAVLSVSDWSFDASARVDLETRPGQLVVAAARHGEAGLNVSFGVLSSVGPEFRTHAGGRIDRYLRPDLTFYPGFSGGPLISAAGNILGMNTSGLAHGLPMTIPSATVNRVVDQLLTTGRVNRGYLGLRLQAVDLGADLAKRHNLEGSGGLLVVGVESEGPALKAGMLVGDVITGVGDNRVAESDDVQVVLDPETVGKSVPLAFIRGGEMKHSQIVVTERPVRSHRDGHR